MPTVQCISNYVRKMLFPPWHHILVIKGDKNPCVRHEKGFPKVYTGNVKILVCATDRANYLCCCAIRCVLFHENQEMVNTNREAWTCVTESGRQQLEACICDGDTERSDSCLVWGGCLIEISGGRS